MRNQKAVPSVARIVGITIASMMPVELSIMSRSVAATGPFGSSTPSVQPPSAVAPIKRMVSAKGRISDPLATQESREQHKQVQDGKREQLMCRPLIGCAASCQSQRKRDERRSADGGDRTIDCASKSKRPGQ